MRARAALRAGAARRGARHARLVAGRRRDAPAHRPRRGVDDRAAPGAARRPRLGSRRPVHLRPARLPARAAARVPVVGAARVRVGRDRAGRARRHAAVGAAARVPLVHPRGAARDPARRRPVPRADDGDRLRGRRRARGRARARPRRAGARARARGAVRDRGAREAQHRRGDRRAVRDRARRGAVAAAAARGAVRARGRRHRGDRLVRDRPVRERDRGLRQRRAGDRVGLLGGDGVRGPEGGLGELGRAAARRGRLRGGVARGRGAAAARAAGAPRAVGGAGVHDLQGGLRAPRPRPLRDLLRVAAGRARRVRVGAAPAPDRRGCSAPCSRSW